MVNCNPETVSTDYDTSDRLYFEPLGVEEVLAICEREQPVGVVIQFGGQTPLKLARAIEAAGFRVLGTPFEAVDLAEDRERFAALCGELEIAVPPWGMASGAEEAVEVAERVGYPVLVRPSYVLGGRSMRICYDAEAVRDATQRVPGPLLVDRFLENAIEIDVDALCDGEETFVAAVMQHVEEAGIHSGDSSCVLPPPSLTRSERRAGDPRGAPARACARGRRPAQRPARARRRGALRARGEPARLTHRSLREQGDRHEPRPGRVPAGRGREGVRAGHDPGASRPRTGLRQGGGAAVRPLPRRRPGARPGDALDRRGDGERVRPAHRLRQGRARGRPAAAFRRHRVPLGARRGQARRGAGGAGALRARLPVAGDRRHRPDARRRRARGRVRAQGDRGGRRAQPSSTSSGAAAAIS